MHLEHFKVQTVEIDLSAATTLLSMALGELAYIRDSWDTIITTAKATATIWKFTVARKRYTKKFFDELNSDDQRLQVPELSVKTHIFWQS